MMMLNEEHDYRELRQITIEFEIRLIELNNSLSLSSIRQPIVCVYF